MANGNHTQVGKASPSPSYPQTIYNTGDEGYINEKVQNKNLFDLSKASNGYINYTTGSFTATSQYTASDFIKVEEGEQYYSNYIIFDSSSVGLSFYDENKAFVSGRKLINLITVPEGTKYIRFCVRNSNWQGSSITDINTLYFVKGSTATEYVAHEEQEINFPLSSGQNFYEGDYLADDGVHHVMTQVDLSTLTWTTYATNKYQSQTINNIKIPATGYTVPNMLAEKYRARTQQGTFKNGEIGINSNGRLFVCDETGTPSGIVQYELATEVIDPYTEEQQAVWNEIKALRTYKGGTHIDSSNNVKPTVDLKYVADTKLYIDSKIATLTNAITSLGGNV